LVERAVHDAPLQIDHLIAGVDAAANGFLDAVDDGWNVFLGNGATHDLVEDFDALAFFIRLDLDAGVPVLTAAAGLPDELPFAFGRLGNGLAVGNLRGPPIGLDLKLALQAVDDDFQVQFAHAGDDQLAGFLVGKTTERGVFFGQALQAFGHLIAVRLGLRLDRHADDGLREGRRFQGDIEVFVAQGVARRDVA